MKDRLKELMDSHKLMRIATLDESGFPNVRSVDFVCASESAIYFTTFKQTRKVKEIAKDNRVYFVIDREANTIEELARVQYVRGRGKAFMVDTPEEMQESMGMLLGKYPFLKDLPGDPTMMNIYRVDIDTVELTDNTKGFGHVDIIEF